MKTYQESLKVYRDNKNAMDYAIKEAVENAVTTAVQKRDVEIAKQMKKDGHPVEMISRYTSLTNEQIEKL